MAESVSIALSLVAVVISAITAWLTLFRRGTVRMTQPTVIYLGPDGPVRNADIPRAKVYLRSLLYATSKSGRIVENMFIRLRRLESSQTFNIWVHGEEALTRGSGLYVGENGVLCNHHFLLPPEEATFQFRPGDYTLEIYASLAREPRPLMLFTTDLTLSTEQAKQIHEAEMGIYFDWGPDSRRYYAHSHRRSAAQIPSMLRDILRNPEEDLPR